MANTTVKGKFNVVAENGDVQTIYPKTTGDQVLVDRSSNASVIPNDVANLQHIVNKMGSLALKSKVETSDFTTGTIIGVAGTGNDPCANLKANTDAGKIADALIVKNIESRVDTLENSNLVTVDELDAGLATKPDTEINDAVTSTSLTWSSKKLSDQLTELNSNTSLLTNRVDNIIANNNDTEGNSELIDIRIGADGVTYTTAGKAVRTAVKIMQPKKNFFSHALVKGTIDESTGAETFTGTILRSDFIKVHEGSSIVLSFLNNTGTVSSVYIYEYAAKDTYNEIYYSINIQTGKFTVAQNTNYIRICFRCGTSADAVPENLYNIQLEYGETKTSYEEYILVPSYSVLSEKTKGIDGMDIQSM